MGNQGAVQLWAESRQAEYKPCGWREGKGLGGLGQLTTAGLLENQPELLRSHRGAREGADEPR